jgi:aerobic-type carbon monoxide dehydrogenase small subunit (CoxS/CutS family)
MPDLTELLVNGQPHQVGSEPDRSLLAVLRNELGLTGCKYGCGEGQCGACTVLVDGAALRSCTTMLSECAGKQITTIEGLEHNGRLHPLQEAFLEAGAMQCGYCTPGMILAGAALLQRHPEPTAGEIIRGMNGNICRCGTYARIVSAIQRAAVAMKGGAK